MALRAYHLGAPLLDHSDWRQGDTASIARFYFLQGVRWLHPQVLYGGPGPNYVQVELPIGEAMAAWAAHLFGWGPTVLHGTAVVLSAVSLVGLYGLLRLELGRRAALWGAALYALAPLAVFYGRAFQAEPAMMCFGLLALWAFSAWAHAPSPARLALASGLFALAIAAKLPNAILGLPILALMMRRAQGRPPTGALVALALPYGAAAAYTLATGRTASGQGAFVTRIALAILTNPTWQEGATAVAHFWTHNLLVGAAGVGMAVLLPLGALALPASARGFMLAWGVALLLWCLFIVSRIRQDYYLLPCCPFFAAMGGGALAHLFERRPRAWAALGVATLLMVLWADATFLPPLYRLDSATGAVGQAIDQACPSGPVVVGTGNPALLYAAWRSGWRTNSVTLPALRGWAASGATVVAPLGAPVAPAAQAWLAAHAERVAAAGTILYRLDCPAHA